MILFTPRLILREFRADDFDSLYEYSLDPEIHRFEGVTVPDEAAVRAYLQRALDAQQDDPRTYYLFAVTIRPDDRAIGRIKVKLNNRDGREWEIGWTIQRKYWGQGYASEAAREALSFAFSSLHAHRVIAFCNAHNKASARVMQNIGMQQDGRLREALWWNGEWTDELVYSILESEI